PTRRSSDLFFNLRSMKPTLDPLTRAEIGAVARQLNVKPEEVAEMEMRLAGQEVALEPSTDDDESYAPIAYLADRSPGPSEVVEARQEEERSTKDLDNGLASADPLERR